MYEWNTVIFGCRKVAKLTEMGRNVKFSLVYYYIFMSKINKKLAFIILVLKFLNENYYNLRIVLRKFCYFLTTK